MVNGLKGSLSYNRDSSGEWEEEETLESHSDWVRDVAWAPNIGLATSKIASCSQVLHAS